MISPINMTVRLKIIRILLISRSFFLLIEIMLRTRGVILKSGHSKTRTDIPRISIPQFSGCEIYQHKSEINRKKGSDESTKDITVVFFSFIYLILRSLRWEKAVINKVMNYFERSSILLLSVPLK